MSLDPLLIEEKEDSPEKLAATIGIPDKNLIKAEDFNKVVFKANELVEKVNEQAAAEPQIPAGTPNDYLAGDKTWKKAHKLKKVMPGVAYTLIADDFNLKLLFTNNAAITVTIPPNIADDGLQTTIRQVGNGQITIVAGAGVVLTKNDLDTFKTAAKGSVVGIDCDSTNSYHIYGHLELL